jgi:hypothetical protein
MKIHRLSAALVLTLMFGVLKPLAAQVTPVSPFTGAVSETWESFPSVVLANGSPMFNGAATITNAGNGPMGIYEPSAGIQCGLVGGVAGVHDGVKGWCVGGGPPINLVTITFSNPISDFGAYWATAFEDGLGDSVTLLFRDLSGLVISTQSFQYTALDGSLEWHGWHSTVPIKSISFSSQRVIANDGLQINFVTVPEPTVLGLVTGALVVLLACGVGSRAR